MFEHRYSRGYIYVFKYNYAFVCHCAFLDRQFFTPKKVKEEGVLEKLGDGTVVVHIHFGMSGSFQTYNFPGD